MIEENPQPNSYQSAIDCSVNILAQNDPAQMARRGGGMYQPEKSVILLPSLGQLLQVTFPGGFISFKNTINQPLWQWRLLATNYLGRADDTPLNREMTSFRELDGGNNFYPAFQEQTLAPLGWLADNIDITDLNNACLQLGGELHGWGDAGASFNFFPFFPVTIIFWQGDDELGASANMLFDGKANHYLHTEDISVVGNLLVDFLINLCRLQQG